MDLEDQAFLRRFQNLPKPSRQAIYRGILEQLNPDEWRDVKIYADMRTFQCDILGNLPLEIACLVAEYLPLVDIIRLRRVSRRWQQVLSSPALCRAAVRATVGKDPWARDSHPKATIYANLDANSDAPPGVALSTSSEPTPASAAIAPSAPFDSYSAASFTKVVKRRRRLEQGIPYKITTIKSPLGPEGLLMEARDQVTYSDGSCAWLDSASDLTTVVVLNLRSGERTKFTTDNREKLQQLAFSKPLIAAVSTRGYCHVWNLDTSQSSSFRLPSCATWRTLISGTKVVIDYIYYFIYWSFDTGMVRQMKTGDLFIDILALAPHPSEERITIARLCPKDPARDRGIAPIEECQVQVSEYSMESMTEISSRYQLFPKSCFPKKGIYLDNIVDVWGIYDTSQGNLTMRHADESQEGLEWDSTIFSVSIEADGLIAFHTFPGAKDPAEFSRPEQGIVYSTERSILKPRITLGPSNSYVWYDYHAHRSIDWPSGAYVLGDAHFMVFVTKEGDMVVWTMDEPDQDDQDIANLMNGAERTF